MTNSRPGKIIKSLSISIKNSRPDKIRGLSSMKNNQPDNQQLSQQKLDSFRPMTTARSEMIKMRLQNMQLQHTSRNAILVEENLTQKLCKRIKRFVKKFL